MSKINADTILTFGKYKNKKICQVPPEYLLFIFENNCCPANIAFYINHNLDDIKKKAIDKINKIK